jgi:hypothetical protein
VLSKVASRRRITYETWPASGRARYPAKAPKWYRRHCSVRIIATLYFTREIVIPLAFPLTLTFLLTPAVALLQRLHIGRIMAVFITVLLSVAVAGGIGWIIANQLVDVANQLPLYRQNIHAKVEAFHIPATGPVGQAAKSVQEVVRELTGPGAPPPAQFPPSRDQKQPNARSAPVSPVPVQMVEAPTNGWTEFRDLGTQLSRF